MKKITDNELYEAFSSWKSYELPRLNDISPYTVKAVSNEAISTIKHLIFLYNREFFQTQDCCFHAYFQKWQ